MMKIRSGLVIMTLSLAALSACTKAGVQGSSLYSSFSGLSNVRVLSPTAVKLSWGLDSRYAKYNIYMNQSAVPFKDWTFADVTIQNLTPDTVYGFRVTGVDKESTEDDLGGMINVKTFANFNGLTSGGVVRRSPTEVNLTWSMNTPQADYNIFMKKKTATWDLNAPIGTVKGSNQYSINGLTAGETYCYFIQAKYEDGTKQPNISTESALNAASHCAQMVSQMPNIPNISVNASVPGPFPWFWVSSCSGACTTYNIEVFDTETDQRVAARVGGGPFRAFTPIIGSGKQFYALISKGSEVAEKEVMPSAKLPATSTTTRSLTDDNTITPAIFPPIINSGNGRQNMGSKLAEGDFNCDGLSDLAVSIPSAVINSSTTHYKENGGVVVYYGYRPAGPCYDDLGEPAICPATLKTDVAPKVTNIYPNPLLISFKPTQDMNRQGLQITTGNFNGDCVLRDGSNTIGSCNDLYRTQSFAKLPEIKSCDDLVVSSASEDFYVIYGNSSVGLTAGAGASTAGINEFTCDSFSNTCRIVRMTATDVYADTTTYANAITAGDYNNDGFDDLAVRAQRTNIQISSVRIYRGGVLGLYPPGSSGSFADVTHLDATQTTGLSTLGALTSSDDFASALGTAYNSRKCVNNTPNGAVYRTTPPDVRRGYDFTKCDDLVIGAPGRSSDRGSIFSCKGDQSDSSDKQRISSWVCAEHFPTEIDGQTARYGSVIHGANNFLGYPTTNSLNITSNPSDTTKEVPSTGSVVFVGSPTQNSSAGAVYAYYLTPLSDDYFTGGLSGILGNSLSGHPIESINTLPCNRLNANKVTGSLYHCNNQKLTMNPSVSGVQFGAAIGSFPLVKQQYQDESSMGAVAIAAPYRNVSVSTGNAANGGSVYLYRADRSTFGTDNGRRINSPTRSVGATGEFNINNTINSTWYSGGVSPYGPSIFYPDDLKTNANFGLGGIVGGNFNNDDESDLVASAPNLSDPSPGNGAVYVFAANEGYQPTEKAPGVTLKSNLSLEGNYRFEEAMVVGDINGDGYDDVVTHIDANGSWSIVVFYGGPIGLITSPAPSRNAVNTQPLLLSLSSDTLFGKMFFPAGDMNGDGFDDVYVMGSESSYIYFGSSAGLVTGSEPAISPVGKGAIRFAMKGSSGTISFAAQTDADYSSAIDITSSYSQTIFGSSVGDFNKDGFDDLAIRIGDYFSLSGSPPNANALSFSGSQKGRVIIIYGSSNGPQVNRLTGQISRNYANGDVAIDAPCTPSSPSDPAACKVQVIGVPHGNNTSGFGFAVASLRRKEGPTFPNYDRLLISDVNVSGNTGGNEGAVYIFEGSPTGLATNLIQTLRPQGPITSQHFGTQIAVVGDINGDEFTDIVVSCGATSSPKLYAFYGQIVGSNIGFYGAPSLSSTDYFSTTIALNTQFADAAQPRPQMIAPNILASTDLWGRGIAGVGDFNGDGFADVAVNTPTGDSTANGLIEKTGYIVILFGSEKGLQIESLVTSSYPKCHGGDTPICEPYQVFLPHAVAYENTSINPYSAGDMNGDGVPDLLIGGIGRDLSAPGVRTATSVGVLYVLY